MPPLTPGEGNLPLLNPLPILHCCTCSGEFSALDLALFLFDFQTMTCSDCHAEMLAASRKVSCFGKLPSGSYPGYDEDAKECRIFCPDSELCRAYLEESMGAKIEYSKEMREIATRLFRQNQYKRAKQRKVARSHPFPRRGTIIRVIWDMAAKGTTVEKIEKLCKQIGGDSRQYLRQLRKEFASGHEWKYSEDENGNIKVSSPVRSK